MVRKDKSLPYVPFSPWFFFASNSVREGITGSICSLPSHVERQTSSYNSWQISGEFQDFPQSKLGARLEEIERPQDIISSASRFDNADQQDAHDFL